MRNWPGRRSSEFSGFTGSHPSSPSKGISRSFNGLLRFGLLERTSVPNLNEDRQIIEDSRRLTSIPSGRSRASLGSHRRRSRPPREQQRPNAERIRLISEGQIREYVKMFVHARAISRSSSSTSWTPEATTLLTSCWNGGIPGL